MNDEELRLLMSSRMKKPGNDDYKSINMTPEQAAVRRAEIRRILKNTCWANVTNDEIDNMRLLSWDDSGIYIEDASLYTYCIPGKSVSYQQASFRRMRSMIPFEYMNMTSKDFQWNVYGSSDVSEAKTLLRQFILYFERFRDNGMGLYIYSYTKGSGKSMLASIILNELSRRYAVSTRFIPVLELMEMTKKSFQGDQEEIKQLYDSGVLVIDDLGVQMKKEWTGTVLYRLIDHRYRNKLSTIYTSNKKYTDLEMDERTIDRIDATSYLLQLPEIPGRHQKKKVEKEQLMNEILKK